MWCACCWGGRLVEGWLACLHIHTAWAWSLLLGLQAPKSRFNRYSASSSRPECVKPLGLTAPQDGQLQDDGVSFDANLAVKGDVTIAMWFTDHFAEVGLGWLHCFALTGCLLHVHTDRLWSVGWSCSWRALAAGWV